MIPDDVVETINQARTTLRTALETLDAAPSLLALANLSPSVEATLNEIHSISRSPCLQDPCTGRLSCVFIAAPGADKLAILAEMFPRLAERGWLTTDEHGPLTQALRIRYAPAESPELDTVSVDSWSHAEFEAFIDHPQVAHENRRDAIRVSHSKDAIRLDARHSRLPVADPARLRFPSTIELRPFMASHPLHGPQDLRLIGALTRKPPPEILDTGPLLEQDGYSYNALQLRALIKHIALRDPCERLLAWSDGMRRDEWPLDFVLLPETTTENGVRDEVLYNVIACKARQQVLALHEADELDLIVYLVSCGQTAGLAERWRTIAEEQGPGPAERLAERLIVAVTDTHRYFTDRDIRTRHEDPAIARHIGDHFVATLEENILQRISPQGQKPARICFVDSEFGVEIATDTPYQAAYQDFQAVMANWSEPGKIGHDTLTRLGLAESFAKNAAALADPEDRGQGFLLRQILALGSEKGPALLLGKYLVRTRLLSGFERLLEALTRHYDPQGRLRPNPLSKPPTCRPLGGDPRETIETFAVRYLDPLIETTIRQGGRSENWVAESFGRMCALLKECLIEHGGNNVAVFARRLDRQAPLWIERWGYTTACLAPPHRDLLAHCLKLHAREILHQLGENPPPGTRPDEIEQAPEDRRRIAALLWDLKQIRTAGLALCRRYGVRA